MHNTLNLLSDGMTWQLTDRLPAPLVFRSPHTNHGPFRQGRRGFSSNSYSPWRRRAQGGGKEGKRGA